MLKANWSREAPSFRVDDANSQLLYLSAPDKVTEESSGRFRDYLPHRTEPNEKPDSHVLIQSTKDTLVTKQDYAERLATLNCLWKNVMRLWNLACDRFFK